MKHKAIVIKTEDDKALVSVLREEACAHCVGRVVCGTAKRLTVTVKNPIGAKDGDTVVIERPAERVLGYAALVFLAPVALSVIFYLVFSLVNMLTAGVMALVGFIAPLVVAAIVDRIGREDRLPVITEISVPDSENAPCDTPDGVF